MKKTIMAFLALVLLVLSGCSAPPSPPTPPAAPTETPVPPLAASADDVIGRWSFGSGSSAQYFQFNEDGTYVMARGAVTHLEDSPLHSGPFLFEGGLLTFMTSENSAGCAGQSRTYEVRLLDQGRITLILVEDECSLQGSENFSALVPISP